MATPDERERCVRVAVGLLQTRNLRSISMLKDCLTYIPSPISIRNILTTAVIELVSSAPTTICWLLDHPECLQPEVNVTQIVTQELSDRLTNLGFVQGQDFYVNASQEFEVSEAAKLALFAQSQVLNIQDPRPIVDYLQNKSL
ncbi:MAG: hypothetical protein HC769_27625 [Cyanobacteria bacterium CRU_2_1]|nr:hypothetical protein [Cyanobacteria bacterium RU_5_0]NJR62260.1 hypothetical protein [Cyanobacteria bacterium CRU_2_1]